MQPLSSCRSHLNKPCPRPSSCSDPNAGRHRTCISSRRCCVLFGQTTTNTRKTIFTTKTYDPMPLGWPFLLWPFGPARATLVKSAIMATRRMVNFMLVCKCNSRTDQTSIKRNALGFYVQQVLEQLFSASTIIRRRLSWTNKALRLGLTRTSSFGIPNRACAAELDEQREKEKEA